MIKRVLTTAGVLFLPLGIIAHLGALFGAGNTIATTPLWFPFLLLLPALVALLVFAMWPGDDTRWGSVIPLIIVAWAASRPFVDYVAFGREVAAGLIIGGALALGFSLIELIQRSDRSVSAAVAAAISWTCVCTGWMTLVVTFWIAGTREGQARQFADKPQEVVDTIIIIARTGAIAAAGSLAIAAMLRLKRGRLTTARASSAFAAFLGGLTLVGGFRASTVSPGPLPASILQRGGAPLAHLRNKNIPSVYVGRDQSWKHLREDLSQHAGDSVALITVRDDAPWPAPCSAAFPALCRELERARLGFREVAIAQNLEQVRRPSIGLPVTPSEEQPSIGKIVRFGGDAPVRKFQNFFVYDLSLGKRCPVEVFGYSYLSFPEDTPTAHVVDTVTQCAPSVLLLETPDDASIAKRVTPFPPKLYIAEPTITTASVGRAEGFGNDTGSLSTNAVQETLSGALVAMKACFDDLKLDAVKNGRQSDRDLILDLEISKKGEPTRVNVRYDRGEPDNVCYRGVVRALQFPPPPARAFATVTVHLSVRLESP